MSGSVVNTPYPKRWLTVWLGAPASRVEHNNYEHGAATMVNATEYSHTHYWNIINEPGQLASRLRDHSPLKSEQWTSDIEVICHAVKATTYMLALLIKYHLQNPKTPWTFFRAMYTLVYVRSSAVLTIAAVKGWMDDFQTFICGVHQCKTSDQLKECVETYIETTKDLIITTPHISCHFTEQELNWTEPLRCLGCKITDGPIASIPLSTSGVRLPIVSDLSELKGPVFLSAVTETVRAFEDEHSPVKRSV